MRGGIETLIEAQSTDDLTGEAIRHLTQNESFGMVKLAEWLCGYRAPFSGRARVLPLADGPGMGARLWEPVGEGERGVDAVVAIHWATFDPFIDVSALEIIAWPVDAPERWCLRRGIVDILGELRLDDAVDKQVPLRIYRTPAGWIAGEGRRPGVCVVGGEPEIWRRFEGIPALVCDNEHHHAEVHKATRRPVPRTLPKVMVEG